MPSLGGAAQGGEGGTGGGKAGEAGGAAVPSVGGAAQGGEGGTGGGKVGEAGGAAVPSVGGAAQGGEGGTGGGKAGEAGGGGGKAAPTAGAAGALVDGGDAGMGGDPIEVGEPAVPEPGTHGAVRLLIGGAPVCGGTLITNSWVLTADRCIPADTVPSAIDVGFGTSSKDFHQVRNAIELQRFPGNTAENRQRDVILIGVDRPFLIDGSTTNHAISLMPFGDHSLLRTMRCVAWDLQPDPTSATDSLRSAMLIPAAIVETSYGKAFSWVNTDRFDPQHGTLLTQTDVGSACFVEMGQSSFLAAVHTEYPSFRRDGQPNEFDEALSMITADPVVHDWVDQVLFRVLPESDLALVGAANVCSFDRGSVELFGPTPDGHMGWFRRRESTKTEGWQSSETAWIAQGPIPPGLPLADNRPGVLCSGDGSIEVVALATNNTLWWQHWSARSQTWLPEWESVFGAGPVLSGASLVGSAPGDFHVYARGANNELRHTRYLDGWTGEWEDLGGLIDGAPAARMAGSEWIDVFARALGQLWNRYSFLPSVGWAKVGETTSDPAATTWAYDRTDVFVRDEQSRLGRHWYEHFWLSRAVVGSIVLPDGELAAVSREKGAFDVFVSRPGGRVWHATWPRRPEP